MSKLTPLGEPQPVTIQFDYTVSREWLDAEIVRTGFEPAQQYRYEVSVAEVDDPADRERLLRLRQMVRSRGRMPRISRPEADIAAFLDSLEAALGTDGSEDPRRFAEEMAKWIPALGSERLSIAFSRGYKVNASYARERAAKEFPTFWVHTGEPNIWKDRTDPSLAALEREGEVRGHVLDAGLERYGTRIVWLTEPPPGLDAWLESHDDDLEACEAILIPKYLGRYHLLEPLGLQRPSEADDE